MYPNPMFSVRIRRPDSPVQFWIQFDNHPGSFVRLCTVLSIWVGHDRIMTMAESRAAMELVHKVRIRHEAAMGGMGLVNRFGNTE